MMEESKHQENSHPPLVLKQLKDETNEYMNILPEINSVRRPTQMINEELAR